MLRITAHEAFSSESARDRALEKVRSKHLRMAEPNWVAMEEEIGSIMNAGIRGVERGLGHEPGCMAEGFPLGLGDVYSAVDTTVDPPEPAAMCVHCRSRIG